MILMIRKWNFFDVGFSVDPLDLPKLPPLDPLEAGPLANPGLLSQDLVLFYESKEMSI